MDENQLQLIATLLKNLNKIFNKLKWLMSQQNYQVFKLYKGISKQMYLLLKYTTITAIIKRSPNERLCSLLHECLELFIVFVRSSDYEKYGLIFVYFDYSIKFYEMFTRKQLSFNKKKLIQQRQMNIDKLNKKYQIQILPISPLDLNFLISEEFNYNQFFYKIMNNQFMLPNPQCVSCSCVLIKQFMILNKYSSSIPIFPVTKQQFMDEKLFCKYICAICNQGGGLLLIGSYRTNGNLFAKGLKFNNYEQIADFQAQIHHLSAQIYPICSVIVQKFVVFPSLIKQKLKVNKMLPICFLVKIFPSQQKISCLKFKNKGYQKDLYQIYKFDQKDQVSRVAYHQQQDKCSSFYTYIHDKYKLKTKVFPPHHNIKCYKPLQKIDALLKNKNEKKYLLPFSSQDFESPEQIIVPHNCEQLKFKYKKAYLFIISSIQKNRYIDQFVKFLKQIKIIYDIQKPFSVSFEGLARSIWMITFQQSFAFMKNLLKQFQYKYQLKPGIIITMPVYRCLQIQSSKLTQKSQLYIKKKYSTKYKNQYNFTIVSKIQKNGQKKQFCKYIFNTQQQAIFTYMIFQELQLKPYFVKINSTK